MLKSAWLIPQHIRIENIYADRHSSEKILYLRTCIPAFLIFFKKSWDLDCLITHELSLALLSENFNTLAKYFFSEQLYHLMLCYSSMTWEHSFCRIYDTDFMLVGLFWHLCCHHDVIELTLSHFVVDLHEPFTWSNSYSLFQY